MGSFMTIRMIRIGDGKPADIHPDEVAHMLAHGWSLVEEVSQTVSRDGVSVLTLSDEELREAIESMTGTAPHHKTGRARLIEKYEAAKSALEG